jgi:hypothetical protein
MPSYVSQNVSGRHYADRPNDELHRGLETSSRSEVGTIEKTEVGTIVNTEVNGPLESNEMEFCGQTLR